MWRIKGRHADACGKLRATGMLADRENGGKRGMYEKNRYRIVFIDDEVSTLTYLKYAVKWEKFGIEVSGCARDGEKGLELIRTVHPDIVITDILMPKCGGLELLEEMRREGLDCKVFILTAHAEFEYAREALKLNATDYLLKPIDDRKLEKQIEAVVRELDQEQEKAGSRLCEEREARLREFLLANAKAESDRNKEKRLAEEQQNRVMKENRGNDGNTRQDTAALEEMFADTDCFISCAILDDRYIENTELIYEQLKHMLKRILPEAALVIWRNRELKGILKWESWQSNELKILFETEKLHVKLVLGVASLKGKSLKNLEQAEWEATQARNQAFYSEKKVEWFVGEENRFAVSPKTDITKYQGRISEYCISQDWSGLRTYLLSILEREYQQHLIPEQLSRLIFDFFICLKMDITKFYPEKTMNILRHISLRDFEGAAAKSILEARMLDVLHSIEERMQEESEEQKVLSIVRKAWEYTAVHYQEESLSLQDVAEYAGVSRNYFSTVFKEYTGKKYWDYLSEYRIEEAKKLLKETGKTNYEIALEIGYKSEYHFSRKFKQVAGVSPKDYRK